MNFFSKLLKRNNDIQQENKPGGMEDFMTLIRVYFQAAMAADLNITNLAALPDLRVFKTTLHVPTANNKLGVGEKARCKKMLKEIYGMNDNFFKEIDHSLRKRCRKVQDIQVYMLQFQNYTQDLMMLVANLLKVKLRIPLFFKSAILTMVEKTVGEIFNKNDYTDLGVMKTCVEVRQYAQKLGFSQEWTTHFIQTVVILAKKEPKAKTDEK